MNIVFLSLMLLLIFVGCTPKKYTWNAYDDNLYAYYKNPSEKEKFLQHLKKTILLGEQNNNVPPGIYAEYGYLLYENQNFSEAIIYFQKERDLYPESQLIMERMIANAEKVSYTEQSKEFP